MKRPDSNYLDLRLLLGVHPEALRAEVLDYLYSPPVLEDLVTRRNELLVLARKGGKFSYPKKVQKLDTCDAEVRDAIVRLLPPGILENLPAFLEAEEVYKDRELRMGLSALSLLREAPPEEPKQVPAALAGPDGGTAVLPQPTDKPTAVLELMRKLYRGVRLSKAAVEIFELVFCPWGSLSYREWKEFLGRLKKRHPFEADLYADCFSGRYDLGYILFKLKGSLDVSDLEAMLKQVTALCYYKAMEAEMGSGPEAGEGGGDWIGRFYAGSDRLLKKKLVDMQTKEPEATEMLNLETDGDSPANSTVVRVEDLDSELAGLLPGGQPKQLEEEKPDGSA